MMPPFPQWFHDTISAMVWSLAEPFAAIPGLEPPYNDVTQFVLRQHAQMPDYLAPPIVAATLGFDTVGLRRGGRLFHQQPPESRRKQIAAWRNSPVGVARDLIRYVESLGTFALLSRLSEPPSAPAASTPPGATESPTAEMRAEIAVIGSGPGGAITACLLAEAGCDVLLVEEGRYEALSACAQFSREEMLRKYRNGGQTVALGRDKINYVEGRCVGGGSEINSGLYHRTPPAILEEWRRDFQVEGISASDMLPHFETCERDLSVSYLPGAASAASLKLHDGASRLGWKSSEIPRWIDYTAAPCGKRKTMTETYIPRFLRAGGRLLPQTRVEQLRPEGAHWLAAARHASGAAIEIVADSVFLCAGAVQTPALLRRSGITRNVGNSFAVHPTVKLVAQFAEAVNAPDMGVPVHQVKQFEPHLSFGCSISSPAHLALGLLDDPQAARTVPREWESMAMYYAAIAGEGRGTVRPLPGFRDPLVRYTITQNDRRVLADGLRKLAEILLEAGATTLYPCAAGSRPVRSRNDLLELADLLPAGRGNLMTVHLFSSCPTGEDLRRCAADSHGRLHGHANLYLNDASLLCSAPGVNPQGSIMALARRNVLYFLSQRSSCS
jgi:choline dehydrogenase-like flavoprotein